MHPKRCSDGGSEDGGESLPSTSRSDNGSRSEEEEDEESESDETDESEDDDDNDDDACEEDEESGSEGDETGATTSEESESEDDDEGNDPIDKTNRNPVPKIVEHDSDSSDGQSDKCPICLSRFGAQDMGTPDSCDHDFCLDCILEWSKNMNTCPVDRRTFNSVLVRKIPKGKVLRKVQVKGRNEQDENETEEEDPTYCEVCHLSDREDRLLLCDGCDMGFHLECLNPPLRTVPVEEWFCPQCAAENGQDMAEAVGIEDGEVMALLEDENVSPRNIGLRSRGGYRLLPRTRQSETVRLRIQRTRATQRRLLNIEDETTQPATAVRQRRAPTRRKRTVKRRRKTTRRRKKTTKSATKSSSDKKPTKRKTSGTKKSGTTKRRKKTRRRRRKTGRKRRVYRKITPVSNSTPKSRLAEQLGLKLLPNRMLPVIDTPSTVKAAKVASGRQYDVAASSLRLFGTRDELIAFDDSYGDVAVAGPAPSAVSRRRHVKGLSTSALLSHRPLSIGGMRSRPPVPSIFLPPPPPESFDLLGSILTSQSLLIGKGNNYTIQRDGSLLPRRLVGLPPHSTNQCPADPVHGLHDNGSGGGGAAKEGRNNEGNASSHGQSSSGHHSESWTRSSSGRSSNDRCRNSSGSTGEGSSHVGVDYNRRTHVSPHKKRNEKEQKKPLDDDDIDIYSDIESGSFENEPEDVSMDRMSVAEAEDSPDAELSSFTRLGNHPDDHNDDGDEAEVRDSDECSDDDLVIDESVKHEEEDVTNAVNVGDDCDEGSQDVSDGEDLVIDDNEGDRAHNACEESSDVDCENPNRCNSGFSDTNRSNLDVDDTASNNNLEENEEQAADAASSDAGAEEEDDDDEEADQQERSDLVDDSNNVESFAADKSSNNLQDSIESPFTEEHDGEAQCYTSGGEGDGEGEGGDVGNEAEEEDRNEQNHELHHEAQEFIQSSEEVEDDEVDDEVEEGGVEHECDEREELEEREQLEEGGNETDGGEYEEENDDEAREEENEYEGREEDNEYEGREEENEDEDEAREENVVDTTERHEGEEYEPTSTNEDEDQMIYESHKDEGDTEEHYNEEVDAMEISKAVNSGAEDVGTDEENNPKTELSHETSFSCELYEIDAAVRQTEERDESNDEAEIDVSKLAHRQKRRAMVSVRETSGSSRHGPSYRHRRRKGSLRDYEDGENTEIGAPQRKVRQSRKSRQSRTESPDDYDIHPRINISELPRIPKLKRDRSSKDRTENNGPSGHPSSLSSASANSASDSKRTGVMARLDKGSAAEISWKKLSHNNKTRNYRDGKPKSEQKHYRAKESKDNSGDKWTGVHSTQLPGITESKRRSTSESDKDKRKDKDREVEYYDKTDRHSETRDWQRTKEKTHRTDKDKYKDKYREKHYKSEKYRDTKEKHKHGKSKEVPIERSKEKTYEKIMVVSEKTEKREKKEQKRDKVRQLERMHREEKHREHRQKREKERAAITPPVVTIRSREASPIESKEVYASGDSIIVNVNFSRPTGKENAPKDMKPTDVKLSKEKELLKMGEEALDVKRRIGDVDVRERLGEKRSPPDEAVNEFNKRMKYDDSKGIPIVISPSDRWNPFDSDVEEPPIPIDSDFHSDGSFSPYRSPLQSGLGNDSDSDSDVVEIIQPSNVVGLINPIVKDNKRDDPVKSPDTISDEFEDFANCDSNLGETIPRSPPSPADDNNSVYDPFDPTKSLSPSPCSSPGRDSLLGSINKAENPEPPPLPELPPLPPEPEPDEPLPPRPDSPLSSSPSSPTASQSAPFISPVPTTSLPSLQTMTAPVTSSHPHPCIQIPPNVPVSVAGPSVGSTPQQPPPPLMAHTMPPPFSLANIHVPPPNYIARTMPPPPTGGPVQLPNLRPMGWPVGAPNLLFPPGGNFLGPPPLIPGANVAPSSQSVTLSQIGTLLHNQAAQLAMLAGGRPPGPGMGIPPPISISALLQSHGQASQQPQQHNFPPNSSTQNGETKRAVNAPDVNDVIDMDVDSPYSPGDTLDTEEPHASDSKNNAGVSTGAASSTNASESSNRFKDRFDCLLGFVQSRKENVQAKHGGHGRGRGHHHSSKTSRDRSKDEGRRRQEAQKKHIVRFEVPDRSHKGFRGGGGGGAKDKKVEDGKKEVTVKMDETQLKILDELPSSAVEMQVKEKFLKKLNRQERVIEEVKLAIKPYYNRREITKEDYKEILRKSVPKICHNKSGEINPVKIKALVEGYVKKFKYHKKGGAPSKGGSLKKS